MPCSSVPFFDDQQQRLQAEVDDLREQLQHARTFTRGREKVLLREIAQLRASSPGPSALRLSQVRLLRCLRLCWCICFNPGRVYLCLRRTCAASLIRGRSRMTSSAKRAWNSHHPSCQPSFPIPTPTPTLALRCTIRTQKQISCRSRFPPNTCPRPHPRPHPPLPTPRVVAPVHKRSKRCKRHWIPRGHISRRRKKY